METCGPGACRWRRAPCSRWLAGKDSGGEAVIVEAATEHDNNGAASSPDSLADDTTKVLSCLGLLVRRLLGH